MVGRRDAIIRSDTIIQGEIRNGGRVEIHGYVEGQLHAEAVVLQPGGRFYGLLEVDNAEINGATQGEIGVKNLLTIGPTGDVAGNIRYGQIAMAAGGVLSGELRNVPPTLDGDFEITVERGRAIGLTTQDITAIDPDDAPDTLTYIVSNARHGFIMLDGGPVAPTERFTQADVVRGAVLFLHDGSAGSNASFEVLVRDASGAASGKPQQVSVAVV